VKKFLNESSVLIITKTIRLQTLVTYTHAHGIAGEITYIYPSLQQSAWKIMVCGKISW